MEAISKLQWYHEREDQDQTDAAFGTAEEDGPAL